MPIFKKNQAPTCISHMKCHQLLPLTRVREVMLMVGVLRGLNQNGIWSGPPIAALASLAVLYMARSPGGAFEP